MSVNPLFQQTFVLIKGAGDLASGVAFRLKRAGFPLVMTELDQPLMVRRTVCFGEAVYEGETAVEGMVARRVGRPEEAVELARSEVIPVVVDPEARLAARLRPAVLIDGIMAKTNTGTRIQDAPLVIALGPGFIAGQDCHAVIETNRGHWLGRVLYSGSAQPDTGTPGKIEGHTADRVLRAPASGYVQPVAHIGDTVAAGQLLATVNGQEIRAPFAGVLRGLIHPSVRVEPGMKIGDLDPRGEVAHCFAVSEKSLAMGGAVLEAILASGVVTCL